MGVYTFLQILFDVLKSHRDIELSPRLVNEMLNALSRIQIQVYDDAVHYAYWRVLVQILKHVDKQDQDTSVLNDPFVTHLFLIIECEWKREHSVRWVVCRKTIECLTELIRIRPTLSGPFILALAQLYHQVMYRVLQESLDDYVKQQQRAEDPIDDGFIRGSAASQVQRPLFLFSLLLLETKVLLQRPPCFDSFLTSDGIALLLDMFSEDDVDFIRLIYRLPHAITLSSFHTTDLSPLFLMAEVVRFWQHDPELVIEYLMTPETLDMRGLEGGMLAVLFQWLRTLQSDVEADSISRRHHRNTVLSFLRQLTERLRSYHRRQTFPYAVDRLLTSLDQTLSGDNDTNKFISTS